MPLMSSALSQGVLLAPRRASGLRRAAPGSRLRVFAVAEVQTEQQAPANAVPLVYTPTPAAPAYAAPHSPAAPVEEEVVPTVSLAFIVPHLRLDFGMHLRIVGGGHRLGDWSACYAPEMTWHEGDVWTAVLALPPGDHIFKLVIVNNDGVTHWELGANRRLHVPLACVEHAAELEGAVKVLCPWGETASTRLQPSELGCEQLRAAVIAAETALAGLLYEKAKRQQDSHLEAAIAQQIAELERIQERHRAVEAAAESKLMGLLYQREARTGTELAGRIMILKERIERLQDARRTLDALTLEGGWAAPAVQPPHGL